MAAVVAVWNTIVNQNKKNRDETVMIKKHTEDTLAVVEEQYILSQEFNDLMKIYLEV